MIILSLSPFFISKFNGNLLNLILHLFEKSSLNKIIVSSESRRVSTSVTKESQLPTEAFSATTTMTPNTTTAKTYLGDDSSDIYSMYKQERMLLQISDSK